MQKYQVKFEDEAKTVISQEARGTMMAAKKAFARYVNRRVKEGSLDRNKDFSIKMSVGVGGTLQKYNSKREKMDNPVVFDRPEGGSLTMLYKSTVQPINE